jgi:hypothetical protein
MESTEMQSNFALVNNIKFEDKIDIEDLVLPPKPTGTPIMEKIDIKEEPLDIDIIAVHERTKQSGFAGIRFENEDFPSNMENQISKLFEELDQLRVEKVKQLFEKYHKVNQYGDMNRTTVEMLENNLEEKKTELSKLKQEFESNRSEFEITNQQISSENTSLKAKMVEITEEHKVALFLNSKTMKSIVKMHEKSLEDKDIELKRVSEELQIVKVTNLELSKRIQQLDIPCNQVSGKKKSSHSDLTLDGKKVLQKSKQSLNKQQKYGNQNDGRNKKIISDQTQETKFIQKSHNYEKLNDFKKETLQEIKTFTPHEHSKNPTIKDHVVNVHEEEIANNLPDTKLHQKTKKGKLNCSQCAFSCTKFPSRLKRHISAVHENIRPLGCEVCGKTFRDTTGLNVHVDSVHNKIRKFHCIICDNRFSSKQKLNIHIANTHGNNKPN